MKDGNGISSSWPYTTPVEPLKYAGVRKICGFGEAAANLLAEVEHVQRERQAVADDRRIDGGSPGDRADRGRRVIRGAEGKVSRLAQGRTGGQRRRHARREQRPRYPRRGLGRGPPAALDEGVGPGEIDYPVVLWLRGDGPSLLPVGRVDDDASEFHETSSDPIRIVL